MIFDRAHFAHMTGGDAALQAEVLALFRNQVADWSAALAAPAGAWRDVLHTLKGSARGVGFWVLADACAIAEAAGETEAGEALARVRAALAEALSAAETA